MDEFYTDYICALPSNWIPGEGMQIDIRYSMEQAELFNYAQSVIRFNRPTHTSVVSEQEKTELTDFINRIKISEGI